MPRQKTRTKLCKYCKTEIPYGAKVCPNCKGKQGTNKKTIAIIVVFLLIITSLASRKERDDEPNETETTKREQGAEQSTKPKEAQKQEKLAISFDEELKEYENGDYPYITNEDLSKYHANMKDVSFCTTITVDDVKDGVIQATIGEGFMMSNFNMIKDYGDNIEKETVITVIGKVGEYKSYGFMGKSLSFSDCMIIAMGDDVKAYKKENSDESLEQYFVATSDVAKAGIELSEEEYKDICETLSYNDILRNPDSNKDKYCKVSGNVSQVIEGLFGTYTIFVSDSNGEKWECSYSYKEGESHILEGDSVVIYGKCKGTTTSSTVLGKQVTMPDIRAEYIDIR